MTTADSTLGACNDIGHTLCLQCTLYLYVYYAACVVLGFPQLYSGLAIYTCKAFFLKINKQKTNFVTKIDPTTKYLRNTHR